MVIGDLALKQKGSPAARADALLSAPLLSGASELQGQAAHEAAHACVALALGDEILHLSAGGDVCLTRGRSREPLEWAAISLAGALGENRDITMRAAKADDWAEVYRRLSPGDLRNLRRAVDIFDPGAKPLLRNAVTLASACLAANLPAFEALKRALLRGRSYLEFEDVQALWATYRTRG